MPLGIVVGLNQDHIVLDGITLPLNLRLLCFSSLLFQQQSQTAKTFVLECDNL